MILYQPFTKKDSYSLVIVAGCLSRNGFRCLGWGPRSVLEVKIKVIWKFAFGFFLLNHLFLKMQELWLRILLLMTQGRS